MTQPIHDDVRGTRFGRDWHRRCGTPICDDCRIAWNECCRESRRQSIANGWTRGPRRKTFDGVCAHCGVTFRAEQPQPFCSHQCHMRSRYGWSTSTDLVRVGPSPAPPHRLGIAPTIDLTPRRSRVWCSGPCVWCGEDFTIIDQTTARYCSNRCAKKAQRAVRDDRFRIAPRERLSIYERDGWTCQLCGDPVDQNLLPSHRWAATLDHIECQSWALIPDHSAANLRLAHRMCNSTRGDESWQTAA